MSKFAVNILGCGSATPTLRHLPSCQIVDHRDRLFMIDCGEGAQLQMQRMKLHYNKLNHIFISHLHGDHFLGLPGLLSTMALHEKGAAVTVHTFSEGAEMIRYMVKFICGDTPFDLKFNIIDPGKRQELYADDSLTISSFPLYHRVPCVGFIFREKPKLRHADGDALKFYGVPHYQVAAIRAGADFVRPDGTVVANERLTRDADPALSYAYCSDTMFDRRVISSVRGVHTIYHESTYADDNAHLAEPRGHSTARQAGKVAQKAGAKTLILGHYSKRYRTTDALVAQAQEEFTGQVIAADEGMKIELIKG